MTYLLDQIMQMESEWDDHEVHLEAARLFSDTLNNNTDAQEAPMSKSPQVLRDEAARLLAAAERLENRPTDDFENESVIVFDKTIGGRTYSYAAIKAVGKWFRTGKPLYGESAGYLSWDQLLDFIGDDIDTIHYVTALKPLD